MARAVRAKYENGVLKPLDRVDLEEGEVVEIAIRRSVHKVLDRYTGILGEAKVDELRELEEEAQCQ